jgi:hypothetical protein
MPRSAWRRLSSPPEKGIRTSATTPTTHQRRSPNARTQTCHPDLEPHRIPMPAARAWTPASRTSMCPRRANVTGVDVGTHGITAHPHEHRRMPESLPIAHAQLCGGVTLPEQNHTEQHRQGGMNMHLSIAAQGIGRSKQCTCRCVATTRDGASGVGVVSYGT